MYLRRMAAVASLLLTMLLAAGAALAANADSAAAAPSAMPGPEMMKMMEQGRGMMDRMQQMGTDHALVPHRHTMNCAAPGVGMRMMEKALSGRMMMDPGMMRQVMDRSFYLDRAEELGLSADQVAKLRAIQGACRRDNIRTGAEVRIARLDLDDLLGKDDWSLDAAEQLVRKQQKLEGDMLVRHLQALAEARQVLTPEQLRMAQTPDDSDGMNDLFQ